MHRLQAVPHVREARPTIPTPSESDTIAHLFSMSTLIIILLRIHQSGTFFVQDKRALARNLLRKGGPCSALQFRYRSPFFLRNRARRLSHSAGLIARLARTGPPPCRCRRGRPFRPRRRRKADHRGARLRSGRWRHASSPRRKRWSAPPAGFHHRILVFALELEHIGARCESE